MRCLLPHFLALILFTVSVASTHAGDDAMVRLGTARSLKCHFGPGTEARWKGNKPAIASARFDEDIQFDSIDRDKQSARIVGKGGASDVRVLETAVGLSFLETEPAVLDVTTVFAVYTDKNEFPAVDSRHVLYGVAMAEQYYGTCKVSQ